jgi:hypothetical protein
MLCLHHHLAEGDAERALMRATVSIVGIRRLVSMKLIICRDHRVNCASRFSDSPLAMRRPRMMPANASQTGSSAVRGRRL